MKKLYFLFVILITLQIQASNGKYRLTVRGNPATSIVIGWDQTSGSNPTVYYGTTDFGTDYNSYSNLKTPDRTISYKGMNNNFARLRGLTPNTAYYFVIRDSQGTSQRFWFKTAPSNNSRLSFIAGGDSRNNRTPRRKANSLVAKLKPHAVLFGGDMTNGDSSSEWRKWFDDWQLTIATDNRMFPIVATRGNHEDSNNSIYNLFDVPSSNIYYAITFGQNLIRTYTLNTEISISGSQTTWLRNDLNANPNTVWKMAQYHKPMRPHVSSKREGNSQYRNWANLFYNKGVKLVIECDAHTVKTTWPLRPTNGSGNDEGFVRDDANGTVYAGEGCWGAPLRSNNDNKSWTRNSARFNQFKWIFVDENKIEIRTINVNNASQVGSVSNNNVFAIPSNLDIWNPSNGSVVTINSTVTTPDTEAPSTPTNLTSLNLTSSSVSLDWNASTDNVAVSGYDVYQDNTKIETISSTVYNVTGLSPNTSYAFKIRAKDAAGNVSRFSNTKRVTTLDGSGGQTGTVDTSITNGNDDVEEDKNGDLYTNSSDLEFVYDSSNNSSYQVIGLRFRTINIPKNATINNAYLQFTADESNSASASLEISLHDSRNSPAFSSSNNVSGRSTFANKVIWNPQSWSRNENGNRQRSPDLKSMVQSLVYRNGWTSGNNISFIIRGRGVSLSSTSAKRVADSYEGGSSKAPKLIINYSYENGGSTDICVGIPAWQSDISYSVGDNVTYQGNLFERIASDWKNLGACGDRAIKNTKEINFPPLKEKEMFSIHPNPFTNTINISTPLSKSNSNYTVIIYNLQGKVVHKEDILSASKSSIILPKVNHSGIYLLSISDKNGKVIKTRKLIRK